MLNNKAIFFLNVIWYKSNKKTWLEEEINCWYDTTKEREISRRNWCIHIHL